jgi:lipid A 4'-phosphatase
MWAPKFAFDWHERDIDGDESDVERNVTARAMLRWALIVGAVALALFVCVPQIDLACAEFMYRGDHQFVGKDLTLIPLTRFAFNAFFYLTCTITVVGLVMTARYARPWLDLSIAKWLFVTLCLITGPLVVANIGLKDHWGRARPRDVIEFGGAKAFTAPFPPSLQCDYNCSFVSGEASSIFIVFFAAALLSRANSRRFVAFGVVLGSLAGLMRMAQGGHFLSDVVFAGVLMAITAAGIRILFETLESERVRPIEPGVA